MKNITHESLKSVNKNYEANQFGETWFEQNDFEEPSPGQVLSGIVVEEKDKVANSCPAWVPLDKKVEA